MGSINHRVTPYGIAILTGLQRKPMCEGTVPRGTVEKRRAASKRQKAARRASRG